MGMTVSSCGAFSSKGYKPQSRRSKPKVIQPDQQPTTTAASKAPAPFKCNPFQHYRRPHPSIPLSHPSSIPLPTRCTSPLLPSLPPWLPMFWLFQFRRLEVCSTWQTKTNGAETTLQERLRLARAWSTALRMVSAKVLLLPSTTLRRRLAVSKPPQCSSSSAAKVLALLPVSGAPDIRLASIARMRLTTASSQLATTSSTM